MKMINFTVGPVQANETVCAIGAEQVPYFRTPEFSAMMKENEELMLEFTHAPSGARTVFLTGSGTAGMEAVVMNMFTRQDKVLVVNGGSFGQRFADMLELHEVPHTEIRMEYGKALTAEHLSQYEGKGYTAFLVNVHETSTGVHYDMRLIADFCKRNKLFLVVDAISSFLADEIDMSALGIGVIITGSQKALACPPGISILVLAPDALQRVQETPVKCMYLDLKSALTNGERGQTPFTPAVGTLRQINCRLKEIRTQGGTAAETARIAAIADDFRNKIKDLPFEICSESLSNAVTPLHPLTASANDIFNILKDEYGIWVCPNGGKLKDTVFRVGHIGALTTEDNTTLISALQDLQRRSII